MAQARQAAVTSSVGCQPGQSDWPGHDSTSPPATMAPMPSAMRRSTFSRNTNQASKAVNTPSALSSSDAAEAGMPASPSISSTGPATPPDTTAPASHRFRPAPE